MSKSYGGENQYLIDATGRILPLADYGLQASNLSDVPVVYETARGYGQHGESVLGWHLTARTIRFQWEEDLRRRADWWTRRATIIDRLRPSTGIVTFRLTRDDGSRRDIDGWLQDGLDLGASEDGRGLSPQFSLRCPDPSFYDPAQQTVVFTAQAWEELGFPIGFPISFGGGYILASAAISYTGTWRSYPVFTITGPYTWLRIHNVTTSKGFRLTVAKLAGQTVTINLSPGALSAQDQEGNSLFDEVDGQLADWYLAEGVTNNIVISSYQDDANTSVTMTYYRRYAAL